MPSTRTIEKLPAELAQITPAPLAFFCKKCKKIVAALQTRRKFQFRCPECQKQSIAFGTTESIKNYYRLD